MSPELATLLDLWRDQPPSAYDFPLAEEIFPAASHQYVYYGMAGRPRWTAESDTPAITQLTRVRDRARQLSSALPSNRAYLDRLRGSGAAAMAQGAV